MGAATITVFLLAQNRLVREALSRIFSKRTELKQVGCSDFSAASLGQILSAAPDVLIMDCSLDNRVENELLRELRMNLPKMRIMMIGAEIDEQELLRSIRAGVVGYITKDASAVEITASVEAVARGGAVCSPRLCAFLFRVAAQVDQMPNFHIRDKLGLTNREQQVVVLISEGLTNKEIANRLNLAEQTVRNHVHRMLRKVGVNHRLAIVDICRMQANDGALISNSNLVGASSSDTR
jgi:DNA-binding NarL/FixJ family response regulator